MKKTVLVLFGGCSSEHEVSRLSAASLLGMIDRERFAVHTVGITKDGRWMMTNAPAEAIRDGGWENDPGNRPAVVSPDKSIHGLLALGPSGWKTIYIDGAYAMLHGKNGEDGSIQGLFQLAGVPLVGAGVSASACGMDKSLTKLLAARAQVRQADYVLLPGKRVREEPEQAADEAEEHFKGVYPLFVKPSSAGSSVGVSKARSRAELKEAMRLAAGQDEKVLVEEAIDGRELEVSVLGNENPAASVVGEVVTKAEFYDYEAKYVNDLSHTVIPARIPEEAAAQLREAAVRVFRALGCRGLARVDFFLTPKGQVVLNEINTLPGFTNISMYPKLWEAAGVSNKELVTKLFNLAMEEEGQT